MKGDAAFDARDRLQAAIDSLTGEIVLAGSLNVMR